MPSKLSHPSRVALPLLSHASRAVLIALIPAITGSAWAANPALPAGGAYVAGSGSIAGSGKGLTIDQKSRLGIIDWKSFSIGKGGSVAFDNKGGATLNRVTGGDLTTILGTLKASGTVYLINPQGVVIGKSGVVITNGSFVASTLDVANSTFLAGGTLLFKGTTDATVKNLGNISSTGGDVFLIARSVENDGTITAANGTVGLAAGNQVLIKDSSSDERVFVQVGSGNATNAGTIAAASAELKAAGGNVYALAGSNGGIVRATGTATRDGHVWLTSTGGTVSVAGTVTAVNADGTGGAVTAKGATLKIAAKAMIDTAGTKGHGTIETSGHDVSIRSARITAGKGGNWLVDPNDLTIDAALATTIDTALDAGTNVTEQTTASGAGGNGDIFVNGNIAWDTSASLTLSAYRNIAVAKGVTIANAYSTSGGAIPGLTLYADNTGTGTGTVSFAKTAYVDFSKSNGTVAIFYNPRDKAAQNNVNKGRYKSTIGYLGGSAGYTKEVMLGAGGASLDAYMLVDNVYDLQNMQNNLAGDYAMGRDIDAGVTATWNGGAGFTPIGSDFKKLTRNQFSGIFDGQGYVISGLTVNMPKSDYVGLFGYVNGAAGSVTHGIIRNVGLTSVSVTGSDYVGALIGYETGGTSQNDYSMGTVSGASTVGGLIGWNTGVLTDAAATGTVNGGVNSGAVGGLVGLNGGTLTASHSSGFVSGTSSVGGLIGDNQGSIDQSYSTATVQGSSTVGGLTGDTWTNISNSYATGSVSGASQVGGLIGDIVFGTVTNSHSTGSVIGSDSVGGLIGNQFSGTILQSYSTSSVSGATNVGGLVGQVNFVEFAYSYITQSYSSGHVSGQSYVGGLVGQFDGKDSLIDQSYSTSNVSGVTDVGGLVGIISLSTIYQSFSSGNVTGQTNVGGLVGSLATIYLYYTAGISQSYSSSSVVGQTSVGGLVGYMNGVLDYNTYSRSGPGISQSYAMGPVSGNNFVGGLVGLEGGIATAIDQSYSSGPVSGSTNVGGLVGAGSTVSSDSYWDDTTSGQAYSSGGTGLTTAQMAGEASYAHWDFTNTWYLIPGMAHPILRSELWGSTIVTAHQLELIGQNATTLAGHYTVDADISMAEVLNPAGAWLTAPDAAADRGVYGFQPLGNLITPFVGTLDGQGHSIDGLTLVPASAESAGLFRVVGAQGLITNLNLTNVSIAARNDVGALVGILQGGTLSNDSVTGSVSGGADIGGLVGNNIGGTINQSYSAATVSGTDEVGGLAGYSRGPIDQSFATGIVSGANDIGGLVGSNAGSISQSYAAGTVTGTSDVGGLVGSGGKATLTEDYSAGSVKGTTDVGGLVGNFSYGSIVQSYSSAAISGSTDVGGLIGASTHIAIDQSYWDTTTSGQFSSAGGTALTTALIADQASYTGWDFAGTWYLIPGMAHPIIRSELWGTTIVNAHQLELIGQNATTLAGQYTLGANISMAELTSASGAWLTAGNAAIDGGGYGFVAIGNLATPFTGSLSGQGYTIDGLTVHATGNYAGLFGYLGSGGTLTGIALTDVSVSGINYVGGLVGNTTGGTISQSYVTGAVSGAADVGGLVGAATDGAVGQSFATGSVLAFGNNAGGLVGYQRGGAITQSFSTASVSGASSVGGLVGIDNAGSIDQSYAAGAVVGTGRAGGLVGANTGTVTNSYWDIQASGQSISAGGTGLTTAQLQSALPAGFDPTVWGSAPGDYPYLLWLTPNGP